MLGDSVGESCLWQCALWWTQSVFPEVHGTLLEAWQELLAEPGWVLAQAFPWPPTLKLFCPLFSPERNSASGSSRSLHWVNEAQLGERSSSYSVHHICCLCS